MTVTGPASDVGVDGDPVESATVRAADGSAERIATDGPARSSTDAELLARHAPAVRFDDRELFLPTDVDRYVEQCTLWDRFGVLDVAPTLASLDHRHAPGTNLRFINDEDRRRVVGRRVRYAARRLLTARLGRVSLLGRVLDAVVRLSAWVRPTTPRGTTAAAAERAEELGLHDRQVCYGRVVRAGEWLVLHYAYFYVMNDWRSSYSGLNDHEADWEQAWVYCDPENEEPVWVAASSHENRGEDLRRHWQDPELTTVDGHPVLHAAAGSHAMFFRAGDYVSRIDIPPLRWVFWLGQWFRSGNEGDSRRGLGPALGVPFVDSATGDGREITDWDIRPLDEATGWVGSYRGLWGRDTGDPAQGERGPSGPKFDRTGEIRAAWADPLSIAGLHGTPPPSAAAARVNLEKLERAMETLDTEIRHRGRLLPLARQTDSVDNMASESARLTELLRQHCELEGLRRRILNGHQPHEGIRDHLRNPAVPLPEADARRWSTGGWLTATWAALSVPLLLLSLAGVLMFGTAGTLAWLPFVITAAVTVDLILQRRFRTAVQIAALQAIVIGIAVTTLDLFALAGKYLLIAALAGFALTLISANGAELVSIWKYRTSSRRVDRS
jgi:hypothetical protein